MSKFSTNLSSATDKDFRDDNFSIGVVISNNDPYDGNRIKARIKGIDDHITSDDELPYCFPKLPKFLSYTPLKGELVHVSFQKKDNKSGYRYWEGPIISQPQKISNDQFLTAQSLLDSALISPEQAPSKNPSAIGIYSDKKDVAMNGRNNTDIIHKDNRLQIRVGKHKKNKPLIFNNKNLAYIDLYYGNALNKNEDSSIITSVADKIFLLSHSAAKKFKLTDNKSLITEEQLKAITDDVYHMVYGEVMIKFNKLMKEFVSTHVHPYAGMPPSVTQNVNSILKFDLNSMVCNDIGLLGSDLKK